MTYQEAIDFLFGSLPMYQRQGKAAYKANLDNTRKLDDYFNSPHRSFSTIHVAGTNGKGSVSHMLASVLQQAGYRTGLYTSPHLLDFRERIRINGAPVSEEEVTNFITLHQQIIQEVSPSFFEMTVAMAFDFFARQQVDVALIETGLGGRLDSTNIITPALTIITNISLDHMEFLGNDLVSIAKEKGGIIKQGIPLVIGQANEKIEGVFLAMANSKQAPVTLAYRSFEPSFHTIGQDGASLIRIRKLEKGARESGSSDSSSSDS
ncbi:MAG: Mur ligase family protein, partial [Bacteroidota bacterium]